MDRYRELSFWHDTVDDDLTPRPSLPGNLSADVAIIGGGLTGLWTAYYLLRADPTLTVVVLEREIAGFGASGRNGGWCSALFPASPTALERRHGHAQALAMRRAMVDTVGEVGRVTAAEGIDCDFARGGTVAFVRSPSQRRRAVAERAEAERFGETRILDDAALFNPDCARLHPAKLVRGLARVIEHRGATIYERTAVLGWTPGSVRTTHGTVTASQVVLATEGYGAGLRQSHRDLLPLYSLMFATEPLSASFWDSVGIGPGQTFTDFRHLLVYGQRTADDRIAFGGRGARYHWGSSISAAYDRVPRVFEHLRRALHDLLPGSETAKITHRWGGPLGIPRDWHASVGFDPRTGIGRAGGYVGDGLSTTNLAGRTLADLLTGRESELTGLPWVGHASRRWEPEPLRFAGANLGLIGMAAADVEERLSGRPSIIAREIGPLIGRR
ncbi:FAD-binding oxidoreductase [Diaminobutyricimonas sp. TR449]|uniref:NAD(P)/FAD-dependent oxidoreductase n=1 Tax=Diaminobutyricimonas sp. TR449 TaxID=2708076 RepID=UPI001420A9CF|nr:FAD-binding oxidoreductase [Diaminobutyricimonas sp. TR449]